MYGDYIDSMYGDDIDSSGDDIDSYSDCIDNLYSKFQFFFFEKNSPFQILGQILL
jgi:hypothetical protein